MTKKKDEAQTFLRIYFKNGREIKFPVNSVDIEYSHFYNALQSLKWNQDHSASIVPKWVDLSEVMAIVWIDESPLLGGSNGEDSNT